MIYFHLCFLSVRIVRVLVKYHPCDYPKGHFSDRFFVQIKED